VFFCDTGSKNRQPLCCQCGCALLLGSFGWEGVMRKARGVWQRHECKPHGVVKGIRFDFDSQAEWVWFKQKVWLPKIVGPPLRRWDWKTMFPSVFFGILAVPRHVMFPMTYHPRSILHVDVPGHRTAATALVCPPQRSCVAWRPVVIYCGDTCGNLYVWCNSFIMSPKLIPVMIFGYVPIVFLLETHCGS
jgi:hypothetical protein